MKTKTYSIPDEPRFDALRRELKTYLDPLGFAHDSDSRADLHVCVEAGDENGDAYTLERKETGGRIVLRVRSGSVRGSAHGLHHVLRLLGFGFSFFADSIPAEITPQWPYETAKIRVRPDFGVRGLLPWHNFLNSPTVWNDADYENYFLTLWRWGANTALFHQYDNEPLAAIPDGRGRWNLGKAMDTTWEAPWGGVKGIKISDYAWESGKHFTDARDGKWGAASSFASDPIAAAQDTFAKACRFGRSLDLDVYFGFELKGSPASRAARDLTRRRIAHVLDTYPDLHGLCFWEAEMWSQKGFTGWAESPGMPEIVKKYSRVFSYLKRSPARFAEAARIAEWMSFVIQCAWDIRPGVRIGISGWGGHQWMRFGDFWRGLHQVLPPNVFLAQLDNAYPLSEEHVSLAARGIAGQRELWTIPWVESDCGPFGRSSQWHPQDEAGTMISLARSAKSLGYTGLLGIHWQTAGVELNAAALAGAGWNVRNSVDSFHLQYARDFYSPKKSTAGKVAKLLGDLEALGPGWTGASQQTECFSFKWATFEPILDATTRMTPELQTLRNGLRRLFAQYHDTPPRSLKNLGPIMELISSFDMMQFTPDAVQKLSRLRERFAALKLATPHARRLLATMDFVLAYEAIRRQLAGGPLALQQRLIKEYQELDLPPEPGLARTYKKGLRDVEALWKRVFAAQARRLDTRGDFGNLANINIKAYQAWKQFRDQPI